MNRNAMFCVAAAFAGLLSFLWMPRTAQAAEVAIAGDADGDCRVDALDLIHIRNRLMQDPSSGDHRTADVNGDGKINVLDLIYARNRLSTACSQF
ncbi:MAG TPA: dockerin type I repeat-containing protein, partial [Planctomycetota bacterium]|nr:dockerin type I repeat-containing protein [Planctomycetota bacterium]